MFSIHFRLPLTQILALLNTTFKQKSNTLYNTFCLIR
nr:MAG TPA: hypothetical protein [Caudoviricetes sp.]